MPPLDEDAKRICPLSFSKLDLSTKLNFAYCFGKKCELWEDGMGQCAFKAIAFYLAAERKD